MECEITAQQSDPVKAESSGKGLYLYCVADSSEEISLGKIGIDGHEVYTIPDQEISAVVHHCTSQPYRSEDREVVTGWVVTHQRVVDAAWERFHTVLPVGFDTLIKGEEGSDPEEVVKKWLKEEHARLKEKMEKVRGKAEYGVQIFWDPHRIGEKLVRTDEELQKLDQEIRSKSKGTAYLYRQKLENLLKREMEKKANEYVKEFYNRIRRHVDDSRIEKTQKRDADKQMLMNLSCLLPIEKSKELGEELDEIEKMEGFSVHFTGPWPPYSFA